MYERGRLREGSVGRVVIHFVLLKGLLARNDCCDSVPAPGSAASRLQMLLTFSLSLSLSAHYTSHCAGAPTQYQLCNRGCCTVQHFYGKIVSV